jgi:hypothetical protein
MEQREAFSQMVGGRETREPNAMHEELRMTPPPHTDSSHDYSQADLRILRLVQPIGAIHLLDLLSKSAQHLLDELCDTWVGGRGRIFSERG